MIKTWLLSDYMPKLGIELGSEQEAYEFYNEYERKLWI
jgi:hypothetical protein